MGINRLYTIYDASMINQIETSKTTSNIRYSNDGSKFIIEWNNTPDDVYITHVEAIIEMMKPEWVEIIEL